MEKLPDNLHAVMALFLRDDKVRDVSFAESMHAIDDIRQLHKLGLLEDPDKQWGRYIATTEAGDDYRRLFFPTKDERIADLEEDLRVTNALYEERQRVLAAIPPCPEHGECVPHALEWIGRAKVAMGIASYAPPEGYIALSDAEIDAAEREDMEFRRCGECGQAECVCEGDE